MRTYALYNQSKRIMWFLIICATILSGAAFVGPVLDSVCRVLRERFQWFTFWDKDKDRDPLHSLSIGCDIAESMHMYVHSAFFKSSAKVMHNVKRNSYVLTSCRFFG